MNFGSKAEKGSSTILIVVGVFVILAAATALILRDATPPTFTLTPQGGTIGQLPLTLVLNDDESGLKNLTIVAEQDGKQTPLLGKTFEGSPKQVSEEVSLTSADLKDGPLKIRISAENGALFPGKLETSLDYEVDTKAPRIAVKTTVTNINRGGTGLVVYSLSEPAEKTGIALGDYFFPGYQQPSGDYLCYFSYPWDMAAADFTPKLIALDAAGNQGASGLNLHASYKEFRQDTIRLSDNFLNAKMPQFEDQYPKGTSNFDIFLNVNRQERSENRATLLEIGRKSAAQPLWSGPFSRMPRAATLSMFADHRTYYYQDQEVDQQTHLGLDLASNEQAPVPAANAGQISFAGFFGIYGNCVIIDHGAGLQSLYAHLSSIDVQEGDEVKKDQIIGKTGATGMAGGDHLHFEILVSGTSVNPIEWWDPNWINNNITSKLTP